MSTRRRAKAAPAEQRAPPALTHAERARVTVGHPWNAAAPRISTGPLLPSEPRMVVPEPGTTVPKPAFVLKWEKHFLEEYKEPEKRYGLWEESDNSYVEKYVYAMGERFPVIIVQASPAVQMLEFEKLASNGQQWSMYRQVDYLQYQRGPLAVLDGRWQREGGPVRRATVGDPAADLSSEDQKAVDVLIGLYNNMAKASAKNIAAGVRISKETSSGRDGDSGPYSTFRGTYIYIALTPGKPLDRVYHLEDGSTYQDDRQNPGDAVLFYGPHWNSMPALKAGSTFLTIELQGLFVGKEELHRAFLSAWSLPAAPAPSPPPAFKDEM